MLIFLKLGGSLITDKASIHRPRRRVMRRLFREIRTALEGKPDLSILLGHGSGSFGHVPAREFGTIDGVQTPSQWQGFAKVWQEAHALNRIVMEELAIAGLPSVSFAPSAMLETTQRRITAWNIEPIRAALSRGIIPVVFGDVVFDLELGGTILSTEDLFVSLARGLQPNRILLAGEERGVWAGFPRRDQIVRVITPASLREMSSKPANSANTDVTGGMRQKVEMMARLVEAYQEITVSIFSGNVPGVLPSALAGGYPGTTIRYRD